MKKRSFSKHQKSRLHSRKKNIRYYLTIYIGCVSLAALLFLLGTYFFQPSPCANSLSCQSDLSEKIENGAVGMFHGQKIAAPTIDLASDFNQQSVLGANVPNLEKHIYVDLSKQVLYAYQGSQKVFQTFVSTGRWNKTPVGNFYIWEKLRATRMAGGSGDDAYDLPNVPYVMYFYHDFGLHGAYWHDNFGHTMSHGCVNMRQIDANVLYNWADGPSNNAHGTAVSICNTFTEPNMCAQTNPININ